MRAGLGGFFHPDAEAMRAADFVVDGIEAVWWPDSAPDDEAGVVETERRSGFCPFRMKRFEKSSCRDFTATPGNTVALERFFGLYRLKR